MHPIIINVILGMFVGPEGILAIDSVEANVGPVTVTVGETTDVAFAINGRAVDVDVAEAFVSVNFKLFFA